MTKKSRRIPHKGIDYVAPMPDNEEAASTSGPPPAQAETGIIFRNATLPGTDQARPESRWWRWGPGPRSGAWGRRFSRSCGGRCRSGCKSPRCGAWGRRFSRSCRGFPGGGGKGLNRGFGGCTDRDAFAVPSAVAALCRPCSSGGAFQQLLAPGRLPAAYPRPLGDNHPNLPLPVYRIPGRVVNRAGRLRLPRTSRPTFPHPTFSAKPLNSIPNLPAASVGRTPK